MSRRILQLLNLLISTLVIVVTFFAMKGCQVARADELDDRIGSYLSLNVSGYGHSRPILGGNVGEDVSRTLRPRILEELNPRISKRRGRRSK